MLRFTFLIVLLCGALFLAGATHGPGRFLLVSADGLYVVEPDGKCSWSYTVPPLNGQNAGTFDDLVYDGWELPNGNYLYSAHRYAREVDRAKRTVWEYRVQGLAEVKSAIPLPNGRVAVLNSEEQAIFELESGKVVHRIPLPAKGTLHTRYNLLRRTPDGNYLAALRAENRFVEVDRAGRILHSYPVPSLPVVAERLRDGSTMTSGMFGLIQFDAEAKPQWTFTPEDAAPHFPLVIAAGVVELSRNSWLVVNSDWHYKKAGDNRVQVFTVDRAKKIGWTMPVRAFAGWKRGELEPRTGLTEHRSMVVQVLPALTSRR